jgi:hypothetical protein
MKTLLARRVAETGVWREVGSRTASHWLAEQTGSTIGAAQQVIDTARDSRRPAFRASLKIRSTSASNTALNRYSAYGADAPQWRRDGRAGRST